MGVDSVIGLDCTAKQTLTVQGLVDGLKARGRAEAQLLELYARVLERKFT